MGSRREQMMRLLDRALRHSMVCLLSFRLASFDISRPAYLERHVIAFFHELQDVRVIRVFVACVASTFAGNFAIDFHGDSGIGDANGEWVIQLAARPECFEEVVDTRFADIGPL